jgi:type IV pilus assembly protein PilM
MLEGKIEQILSPILMSVVEEIKKSIHFFQTEEKGEMPKSLILSGGGSGLLELIPFLASQLGMEVVIGNPFTGVKVDSNAAKTIANYSPLYSIAVGLAEKGT